MPAELGYKFRLYPSVEQKELLARTFGHTRFVYNQCLGRAIADYEARKANPALPKYGVSGFDFINRIPALKAEYPWLAEVSSVALQQSAKDLGKAYKRFFKPNAKGRRAGFPRFKKRNSRQSFRLTNNAFTLKSENGKTYFSIAKSPFPIDVRWSRALPASPSSVTILRDPDGRYYASFVCEAPQVPTNGTEVIGIDLGLKDFLVCSDGVSIPNPQFLRKAEKKLAKAQRSLARKKPGSNNRRKARYKVARCYSKVARQRRDFHHKVSTQLVRENQAIGVETLRIGNLVKNHHLAKSISDAGWAQFVEFLTYKVRNSGYAQLVRAPSLYPSTQLCSACLTRPTERLTLSVRQWTCEHCGAEHDRDVNAAINLETLAHWGLGQSSASVVLVSPPEDIWALKDWTRAALAETSGAVRTAGQVGTQNACEVP
jgi:putative transposase